MARNPQVLYIYEIWEKTKTKLRMVSIYSVCWEIDNTHDFLLFSVRSALETGQKYQVRLGAKNGEGMYICIHIHPTQKVSPTKHLWSKMIDRQTLKVKRVDLCWSLKGSELINLDSATKMNTTWHAQWHFWCFPMEFAIWNRRFPLFRKLFTVHVYWWSIFCHSQLAKY